MANFLLLLHTDVTYLILAVILYIYYPILSHMIPNMTHFLNLLVTHLSGKKIDIKSQCFSSQIFFLLLSLYLSIPINKEKVYNTIQKTISGFFQSNAFRQRSYLLSLSQSLNTNLLNTNFFFLYIYDLLKKKQ